MTPGGFRGLRQLQLDLGLSWFWYIFLGFLEKFLEYFLRKSVPT
jgi:hypothetical protein